MRTPGVREGSAQPGKHEIEQLRSGNRRFMGAIAASPDPAGVTRALANADPYAVIVGCSDSRVAPEIVFEETLGNLFVIRVAAHVAGPAEIGSVEYAVTRWDCPLVVVLGHTQCGGVAAVLDRTPSGAEQPAGILRSMNLTSLLSTIRSNVGWASSGASADPWLDAVLRNIHRTREAILTWSPPLAHRVSAGRLAVVEALYRVETGAVDFLDQPEGKGQA